MSAAPDRPISSAYRRLRLPDEDRYWVEQVKCRVGCPVFTDACGYVTAVAEGRDEEAYAIARATNPFVSICGRICGAPCERACRRGSVDAPVSIRAIKRFACEQFGNETGSMAHYHRHADPRMQLPRGNYREKIAVVGSGVAGLTVAHDLARAGYPVTVFEAGPVAGGMLTVGVPLYRLPRELVQAEIDAILSLGVELQLNAPVGAPGRTLADLKAQGFAVIFLGAGLQASRRLDIPGAGLPGVIHGIEFLRLANLGQPIELGPRVVVVGGGNVAFDVARTALRQSADLDREEDELEGFRVTADVARTAARRAGVSEVHVVCLESREEMPADAIEIEEGLHEGLTLHPSLGPRIIHGDGRVSGIELASCLSVFDADRRFSPQFDESIRETIACDTVILAVGQKADFSFLSPEDGIELTDRGLIKVDAETFQTSRPDVFAGGDVVLGPRLFIDAIATGQVAARSIHDYLRRTTTTVQLKGRWEPAVYSMARDWEILRRGLPPSRAPHAEELATAGNRQVEENFPEPEARSQAARCLRCDVQTWFEGHLCIACNGCVDVCPDDCLHLVGLSQVVRDERLLGLAEKTWGIDPAELTSHSPEELDALGAVMLKDETACIRCAMCATRCPTHAFTMRRFVFHRELETAPGAHPRLRA
ncbi:MAG TPA: FAD-dependent oxidoreductase [Thermoanaerobaculia bacterium]|nr:FAD-dependent oxidoreductase [Thermoanaerobaculia bacterium]